MFLSSSKPQNKIIGISVSPEFDLTSQTVFRSSLFLSAPFKRCNFCVCFLVIFYQIFNIKRASSPSYSCACASSGKMYNTISKFSDMFNPYLLNYFKHPFFVVSVTQTLFEVMEECALVHYESLRGCCFKDRN